MSVPVTGTVQLASQSVGDIQSNPYWDSIMNAINTGSATIVPITASGVAAPAGSKIISNPNGYNPMSSGSGGQGYMATVTSIDDNGNPVTSQVYTPISGFGIQDSSGKLIPGSLPTYNPMSTTQTPPDIAISPNASQPGVYNIQFDNPSSEGSISGVVATNSSGVIQPINNLAQQFTYTPGSPGGFFQSGLGQFLEMAIPMALSAGGAAAGLLGSLSSGVESVTGLTVGSVANAAVTGAVTGALKTAVTGGNILTGAATGAISSGVGAEVAQNAPAINSITGSPIITSGLVGAGVGALTGAVTGGNVGTSALTGGISGTVSGAVNSATSGSGIPSMVTNPITGAITNAIVGTTAPTSMSTNATNTPASTSGTTAPASTNSTTGGTSPTGGTPMTTVTPSSMNTAPGTGADIVSAAAAAGQTIDPATAASMAAIGWTASLISGIASQATSNGQSMASTDWSALSSVNPTVAAADVASGNFSALGTMLSGLLTSPTVTATLIGSGLVTAADVYAMNNAASAGNLIANAATTAGQNLSAADIAQGNILSNAATQSAGVVSAADIAAAQTQAAAATAGGQAMSGAYTLGGQQTIQGLNQAQTAINNTVPAITQAQAPYTALGTQAATELAAGLAPGGQFNTPFSMADMGNVMPAYQFALQQGLQTTNNAAAVGGTQLSSANIQNLDTFAQNTANQWEVSAFNQWLQQNNLTLSGLQNAIATGQASANTISNALQNAGINTATIQQAIGSAAATATTNAAAATSNANNSAAGFTAAGTTGAANATAAGIQGSANALGNATIGSANAINTGNTTAAQANANAMVSQGNIATSGATNIMNDLAYVAGKSGTTVPQSMSSAQPVNPSSIISQSLGSSGAPAPTSTSSYAASAPPAGGTTDPVTGQYTVTDPSTGGSTTYVSQNNGTILSSSPSAGAPALNTTTTGLTSTDNVAITNNAGVTTAVPGGGFTADSPSLTGTTSTDNLTLNAGNVATPTLSAPTIDPSITTDFTSNIVPDYSLGP